MNKRIIYIFFVIAVFALGSCNDDFLERYPETSITEGTFWNSEQDLQAYNNQLYANYFQSKGFGSGGQIGTLSLDNLSDNSFVDVPNDIRLGIHSSNNPGMSKWGWSLIRKVNVFLENYKNTNIAENLQERYAAEARLIRALNYYDKVKLYGDLPLVDRVLAEDDELLFGTQTSRNEIVDFIMADINFAVENLPESAPANKFSKYIALAYKARITLHEGTFRKYQGLGGEGTFLQDAADAANSVIASGNYTINTSKSYNSLFQSINLAGNKEVVFFKDYNANLQIYHNVHMTGGAGFAFSGAKSLIDDYLCTDGLPISESSLYMGDDSITNVFANRDKRLSGTFGAPNTYFLEDKIYLNSTPKAIGIAACPSGYQLVKYWEETHEKAPWAQSYMDASLIRYAEVLLTYAEAKVELGSISQAELDKSINLLRAKAGVADMTTGRATLAEIRRERRVELAFEGFRYDDLMRWKQGAKLTEPVLGLKFNANDIADYDDYVVGTHIHLDGNGYIKSNNTYSFDESKNYYFPIPVNELSLNENLVQTPGWEDVSE